MDPVQAFLDPCGRPTNIVGRRSYGPQPAWTQNAPALYMSQMPPQPSMNGVTYQQRPDFQVHQDFPRSSHHPDHGILDDYDRALLAEPHHDRQWQAAHGINRLSLPPRAIMATPSSTALHDPFTEVVTNYRHTPELDFSSPFLQCPPPSARDPLGIYNNPVSHRSHISSSPPISSSPSYQVGRRKAIPKCYNKHHAASQAPFIPHQPSSFALKHADQQLHGRALNGAPPMVQGIPLVSSNELPDRFRSVFSFQVFNAVQSKCFQAIYKSNDNLVLSAPTGSGKTVILELAICRLVSGHRSGQFKIVYMAPTKSLCAERQADWQIKFKHLDLECAELTGDTDQAQLRNVQNASIIITTPEKWDSMTRKWKDHIKLVQLVKLFLIDEVHILKESRGATLEAVVSRMKSVGSDIRFVALSATVPNFEDVAVWLGKDQNNQDLPAQREKFGEEFRPVILQKFVYGLPFRGNDFAFDAVCDTKFELILYHNMGNTNMRRLSEIIEKHSNRKPIMVFCCTRKATIVTAKLLARLWATKNMRDRDWPAPFNLPAVSDSELQGTLTSGVAFHHAGLDGYDRQAIEKGFLEGRISVICCTSTLAVGVNLPCHLVIVKNTVSWQDEGLKEYADLEMMQMLGRAGRPQFGSTATAVIITKQEKVEKYEKLVSGAEVLESCLHLNLIDHLNAEIGLGMVHDLYTAKRWLAGTFLYVRLGKNPAHYNLDGDATERNLDERIEQICDRDIRLLQNTQLVTTEQRFKSTEFGSAMARYYVKFETMRVFLNLPPRAKISEILSVLADAEEFHEVRFRSVEKSLYKHLNSASGIKFSIKVDIAISAQKRSIILQAELGGVDFPTDERYGKHKKQYQQDRATLFTHAHRLVRCIIDCQIHLQDGPATRHALELARSLSAKVWDNSPLQMKQVPSLGPVSVRKLVTAGINSLESLEATEPHRINTILSKQPGFGEKILAVLQNFPKLRVLVKMTGKDLKPEEPPKVRLKAEVGFMNEKVPAVFNRKSIYICFLAERSDGLLIDFRRMSAKKLGNGEDVFLSAELQKEGQYITCYVMCDEIGNIYPSCWLVVDVTDRLEAGTLRSAEVKPQLPASAFPSISTIVPMSMPSKVAQDINVPIGRWNNVKIGGYVGDLKHTEEFPDDDIDDQDLLAAVDELDFTDVDAFDAKGQHATTVAPVKAPSNSQGREWEPQRMKNGKWSCNHKCKDKSACKHLCCRDGVDKAPKAPKCVKQYTDPKANGSTVSLVAPQKFTHIKNTLPFKLVGGRSNQSRIEVLDLAIEEDEPGQSDPDKQETTGLYRLYSSVTRRSTPLPIMPKKATAETPREQQSQRRVPSTTGAKIGFRNETPSDIEASWIDDFPSPSAAMKELEEDLQGSHRASDHGEEVKAGDNSAQPSIGSLNHGNDRHANKSQHLLSASGDSAEIGEDSDIYGSGNEPSQAVAARPSDLFRNPGKLLHMSDSQGNETEARYQRLFLTTSSPEKMAVVFEDPTEIVQEAPETLIEPPSKRQRLDDREMSQQLLDNQLTQQALPSSDAENHAKRLEDLRKRLPWDDMEGIDLEFLLDYADIVEFV
ncbi:Sec63 [Xylographa trunciseda]|nr:Sec63 [Xylographa trunciseda]